MITPFDSVFLIVMLLNLSVVASLIFLNIVLNLRLYQIKRKEKKVKRLTGHYRPRIVEGRIVESKKINSRVAAKIKRKLVSLFKESSFLRNALSGKRGDEIKEICHQLDIYLYYLPRLKSRMKWKRARTCYILGLLRDPRSVEALVILLSDRAPEVRSAAVQAIGSMGGETPLMPLTLLLDDEDKWVVMASLEALSLLSYGYAGLLMHFLKHRNPEVRSRIAQILGRVGSSEVGANLLEALSHEQESLVKVALINSLGGLKDGAAAEALIALASSEEVDISISAVRALGNISESSALEPLISLLGDKRWDFRREVMEALKKIDQGDLISILIDFIDGADESLLSGLLEMTEELKDDKLVGVLVRFLESPNSEIVSKAVSALGEQRDTRATLPLIYILRSSSQWFLRAEAAKALGKIRDGRALGSLQEASSDDNRWVSQRSSEALELLQAGSNQ